METCRKAVRASGCEALHRGGGRAAVLSMAEVILKNIKKVYPNAEPKKKKKDKEEIEEEDSAE